MSLLERDLHDGDVVERRRLRARGIVQGVGFRPFVYRLATEGGLAGHVGNDASGVFIDVEGPPNALDHFVDRLWTELPPLARLDELAAEPHGDADGTGSGDVGGAGGTDTGERFRIVESPDHDGARTLVPPDVATCDECVAELFDTTDHRYRYPFINCTNCGPRFTIIRDLPYDRPATTMAEFALCARCNAEYEQPSNRRYHAQPVACAACGPRLTLEVPGEAPVRGTDAVVSSMQRLLADGHIVAVKGLGGYHLACDATNASAVETLRRRKGRSDKPFAVMVRDVGVAAEVADPSEAELEALTSPARPIVLLPVRQGSRLVASVAPRNPLLGVLLPYTPLHHLLFAPVPGADTESDASPPVALVMTSGNRSNEPICFDDADALERLAGLADAFCSHDRPIEFPCDDSVIRLVDGVVQPIRRARGYAPVPVSLGFDAPPVLATGGELKNTCCVAAGRHAWVGQHVGDMENLATLEAFDASVDAFTTMYRVTPEVIAGDLHPGYLAHRWGLERTRGASGPTWCGVQHHHAHVASVMAEHGLGLDADVLGFAFDGTGYAIGANGSPEIWGGEVLSARFDRAERVAHLAPMPLPGGDEAVRNPCRLAIAWMVQLGLELDPRLPSVAASDATERCVIPRQVERGVGCVPTTSMGRLFDVVSSLLGVRHRVGYEAQAAIELEHLAAAGDPSRAALAFGLAEGVPMVVDPAPVISGLVHQFLDGTSVADLAAAFHVAVADMVGEVAAQLASGRPVALTGGTFQNELLVRLTTDRLGPHRTLTHRLVPPNDGGLALGQAAVAAARLRVANPSLDPASNDSNRSF